MTVDEPRNVDGTSSANGAWASDHVAPAVVFALLIAASLIVAAKIAFDPPPLLFGSDSAAYIEQARHLMLGQLPLVTPWALYPLERLDELSPVFPAGFPAILAFLGHLGLEPRDGALWVNGFSAILLPWLLFAALVRKIGTIPSLTTACLGALSPGVLAYAPMGMTDDFALALAVAVAGLVLNGRALWIFAAAGVIAGYAYDVRNAYVTLALAVALFMSWRFVIGEVPRRTTFLQALCFGFGAAIAISPLLLFNLHYHGELNPYFMGPSTIGPMENVRLFIHEITYDLTAQTVAAEAIARTLPGFVLASACGLLLCWLLIQKWRDAPAGPREVLVFGAIYAGLSAALLIVARTRYEWGDLINLRYTMQETPFVVSTLVAVALILIGKGWQTHAGRLTAVAIVGLLAASHGYGLFVTSTSPGDPSEIAAAAFREERGYLCHADENVLVASNRAYIFQAECGVRARLLHADEARMEGQTKLAAALTRLALEAGGRHVVAAASRQEGSFPAAEFPLPAADESALKRLGWIILKNGERTVVVSR